MTLEIITTLAAPTKDPRYGGIENVKLHHNGEWWGTAWQHVAGFSWMLLIPQPDGPPLQSMSGTCNSLQEGASHLVGAFHAYHRGEAYAGEDYAFIGENR